MRVAFHNLGCKVNAYEMEKMIQRFQEAGHEIGDFSAENDVYIVNTCTVTNIADRKSRQMLHRAKTLNPEAVVVACGCFVETDRAGAEKDTAIDILIGNKDKDAIVSIVEDYIIGRNTLQETREGRLLSSLHDHTRAYIKIQDGCNQFCSYCIIPYARGRLASRDEDEIVREIEGLAENGTKEIVLTGIHLSSYGIDLSEGAASYNERASNGAYINRELIRVIRRAASVSGIERIRLGSLEPRIITDEFLSVLKEEKKVCPHFHLSLQSGSDSVLQRMNRHYDTEEYYHKVEKIRAYFEHPAITTDVIVGFPGESEEEFRETKEFLDTVDFYETHLFKYSRRRGTLADRLAGQLPEREKAARSRILSALDADRRKRFRAYYIGREEEVLFEEQKMIGGESCYVGFTREYVKVACRSEEDLTNQILTGIVSEGYFLTHTTRT